MTAQTRRLATALVAVIVASATTSPALADAGYALPKPDAEGFITIFNGENLAGWQGLRDYWSVEDGAIRGHETKDASRQTFLVFTALRMEDFELRLKYKFTTPAGNSGVQFRSVVLDRESWVVGGYQADLDAEAKFDGSIYDEAGIAGGRGSMSSRGKRTIWDADDTRWEVPLGGAVTDLKAAIRIGDWNDLMLTAKGKQITYAINGHVMTELIDGSPHALGEGVLALQIHNGFTMEVLFKDVKVKPLKKSSAD